MPTTDATATAGLAGLTGLTGLAAMGRNLACHIARHGHTIAVQQQRAVDDLGGHTFELIDKTGTFHTTRAGDRSETEI
jgi:6-phosphogluconate dehydrogenase